MRNIIGLIKQRTTDFNHFKSLYEDKKYDESARFLSEHPEITGYLSRRKKLVMVNTYLDRLNIKLDESAKDHEKFRLDIFAIKFGHVHRN